MQHTARVGAGENTHQLVSEPGAGEGGGEMGPMTLRSQGTMEENHVRG